MPISSRAPHPLPLPHHQYLSSARGREWGDPSSPSELAVSCKDLPIAAEMTQFVVNSNFHSDAPPEISAYMYNH